MLLPGTPLATAAPCLRRAALRSPAFSSACPPCLQAALAIFSLTFRCGRVWHQGGHDAGAAQSRLLHHEASSGALTAQVEGLHCWAAVLPLLPTAALHAHPQFYKDGAALPATVIALESGNIVTQVKSAEKDGYTAVQVGAAASRHLPVLSLWLLLSPHLCKPLQGGRLALPDCPP